MLASDIKLLASERPTDNPDGGGYASANEVLDNVDNNVFPDIASGDRVAGRSRIRLIVGGVRSPDTDVYMASRAYLSSPPADSAVDIALFPVTVGATHDEMMEVLYRYSNTGANSNFRLYSNYDIGETVIGIYYAITNQTLQPTTYFQPGDTLILEDSGLGSFQTVTIKQASWFSEDAAARIWTFVLSQPLTASFRGAFYTDSGHADYVTPTQIYRINPLEIPIYGMRALSAQADSGDSAVVVTDNAFALAPIVHYLVEDSALHDGLSVAGGAYVKTATAAASRTQVLPVVSTYYYLHRVTYRYQGAWKDFAVFLYNTSNFIVTLPDIPDAGSTLLYYLNTNASYASGTVFVFRLRAPVTPGSVHLSAVSLAANVLTAVDNGAGAWTGAGVSAGSGDYATGLFEATLTEACALGSVVLDYQTTVIADDLDGVGIDLAKLPPSKTAPLFRIGDTVMVHHTVHQTLTNPVASSTTYTLSRANVDQVWLEAANGTRIPTAKYTVNLATASVTMAAGLDLSGYSQPLEAFTTIHDESVIVAVSGDGTTLQLNHTLDHTYLEDVSYVSSILKTGDLSASATVPFSQQAWTSVWSDSRIGDVITPQYNAAVWPVEVSNNGAITERWRFHFTSTTIVNVIGERVGQIATGLSITADIAPINPYTGTPYFTIRYQGWGAGWSSGNILRDNTLGADAGIGCLQTIQPSEHVEGVSDRFRLAFLGDVDA